MRWIALLLLSGVLYVLGAGVSAVDPPKLPRQRIGQES